jgi:hypothetical protein
VFYKEKDQKIVDQQREHYSEKQAVEELVFLKKDLKPLIAPCVKVNVE